ncbi:MAG: hypothetical protein F6K39_15565, partial [Okeania sp. SIO3B3]|nr:hypothetical protein [Okeania sp. SIO3B3]
MTVPSQGKNFAQPERKHLHFVEPQKKSASKGISPCIGKKIIVLCNYWGSFVPTHDFLFNQKTSPDTDFATDTGMIILPSKSDRLFQLSVISYQSKVSRLWVS